MAKKGMPVSNSKISFKARKKKKLRGKPENPDPAPRLKGYFDEVVNPALKEHFKITSDMAVPRVTKVIVNMGVGDANDNPKKLEALMDDLEIVTGQRPQVTRARVSVANFQLREGMAVGCRVTLRKAYMWEFLDRLISLVLPRLRDFRGLSPKSFDRRGNYNFGLNDQLVFPEIKADRVAFTHGMNITVCTTAPNDEQGRELLRLLGFPFRNIPVVITHKGSSEEGDA